MKNRVEGPGSVGTTDTPRDVANKPDVTQSNFIDDLSINSCYRNMIMPGTSGEPLVFVHC